MKAAKVIYKKLFSRTGTKPILGIFENYFELLLHSIAWIYLLLASAFLIIQFKPEEADKFFENITNALLFTSFFYLNTYYFIPRWISQKSLGHYLIRLIGIIVLLTGLSFLFGKGYDFAGMSPTVLKQGNKVVFRIPAVLSILAPTLIVSFFYRSVRDWFLMDKKQRELDELNKQTELLSLKAQLDPHFLFNSLNGLYALALQEKAPKVSRYIEELSDLLRYVLYSGKESFIPLSQEIDFLEAYIELEKRRIEEKHQVTFSVKKGKEADGLTIIPLLLLPFVENAFKYGISSSTQSQIKIELEIINRELFFSIRNTKHTQQKIQQTGIGIANTQRRLELSYPQKHQLSINESATDFNVYLSAKL